MKYGKLENTMVIEEDRLTINSIRDIYKSILDELNSNDKVCIDLKNIDEIDLSGLQLLVSLKKTCKKQNKNFSICNIKDELLYSFELSGLDSHLEV